MLAPFPAFPMNPSLLPRTPPSFGSYSLPQDAGSLGAPSAVASGSVQPTVAPDPSMSSATGSVSESHVQHNRVGIKSDKQAKATKPSRVKKNSIAEAYPSSSSRRVSRTSASPPAASAPLSHEPPQSTISQFFRNNRGQPLLFYIQVDLRNRNDAVQQVKRHGGKITADIGQADYVILNPQSSKSQTSYTYLFESALAADQVPLQPTYIRDCTINKTLLEIDNYIITPPKSLRGGHPNGKDGSPKRNNVQKGRASMSHSGDGVGGDGEKPVSRKRARVTSISEGTQGRKGGDKRKVTEAAESLAPFRQPTPLAAPEPSDQCSYNEQDVDYHQLSEMGYSKDTSRGSEEPTAGSDNPRPDGHPEHAQPTNGQDILTQSASRDAHFDRDLQVVSQYLFLSDDLENRSEAEVWGILDEQVNVANHSSTAGIDGDSELDTLS
ncbi:hypothetical protein PUNSTDRAFT_117437 [Punctularia strigosozonata HHB-11173 SS5]|uniref:uncharacterized protein n=1 Tax=Punctularia strigosozonata (strain HHB-11173) TaxID=741275 RepID=UPI0004417842|nr:uncharacterized protein PUNSTDRAFT_117437 [Punctularia strigosozonata HHB-11173 SS5]EIN13746.1 hypothetical protein PUNSTDRAFT_117437 [Punctularia strigosozonata HHB-11173 SS5]